MTAEKEKVGVERHRSRKAEKQEKQKSKKRRSRKAEKQEQQKNRNPKKKINFIKKIMPKLNSPPKESHDFKRAILLKMFLSACHVW